jgi:hypothetical protein
MAEDGELTPEQVESFIRGQVDKYKDEIITAYKATEQSTQTRQTQQPAQTTQDQQRNIERTYVDGLIGDDIRRADFNARDARDAVDFYVNNPYASEYKDEVEKTFAEAAKNGRPTSRSNILEWLMGREYRTDPAKFQEKHAARQKQEVRNVESAMDMASQATGRTRDQISKLADIGKLDKNGNFIMKTEEAEALLEGMTF